MKLHENQLNLIRFLARFNLLDYQDCLQFLDTAGTGDRTALSYMFRPLTKNGYLIKHKDGSVSISAKGRALFPEITPLISTGGRGPEQHRVMKVSHVAALMDRNGIPVSAEPSKDGELRFIPSACWRNIAPGILSTTRFVGVLAAEEHRLAVYDIGDGKMEWQVRAEGSLFYTKYGSYKTKATGMLLICREDDWDQIAQNIIRHTMWHRRRLMEDRCLERNRPTRWSRSPIVLRSKYEHVYLTTPKRLAKSLQLIWKEEKYIEDLPGDAVKSNKPQLCDAELWPRRLFVNPATDLLKYVYFFAAVKDQLSLLKDERFFISPIQYEIYIQPADRAILQMYPEIVREESVTVYVYRSEEDDGDD